MRVRICSTAALVVGAALTAVASPARSHVSEQTEGAVPAPYGHGGERRVLPGGRAVTPVGTQIEVQNFPLRVAPAPDGIHALVTNNGIGRDCVSWVNVRTEVVEQTICSINTDGGTTEPGVAIPGGLSFGVAYLRVAGNEGLPFTGRIYVSGAAKNHVLVYPVAGGVILGDRAYQLQVRDWPAGMAFADGKIYVARLLSDANGNGCVAVVEPGVVAGAERVSKECIEVGSRPWAVVADGSRVYVASRGTNKERRVDDTVSVIDSTNDAVTMSAGAGDHPAGIAAGAGKVFVANANSDDVVILDAQSLATLDRLSLEAYPGAGFGSIPTDLVLSPDASTLYVANSGLNSVALIDLAGSPAAVLGHLPTDWYPSSLALSADGNTLYVSNARRAIPRSQLQAEDFAFNYALFPVPGGGTFTNGTLSIIDLPAARARLGELTALVRDNNRLPAISPTAAAPGEPGCKQLLPAVVCDNVKHVFFVVRENKTYDQVFGDIRDEYPPERASIEPDETFRTRRPNGDPTLVFWPYPFTANARELARAFVLLDNYYTETEVSEQGHQWTSFSIMSDYWERMWPLPKGMRGDGEEDRRMLLPPSDSIFENLHASGISWRNYGELSARLPAGFEYALAPGSPVGNVPAAIYSPPPRGSTAPFGGFELPDELRVRGCSSPCSFTFTGQTRTWDPFPGWLGTFTDDLASCGPDGAAAGCRLPAFEYLVLPRDHTAGIFGTPDTPQEQVADNDRAIGFLVETISKSAIWRRSAIFIIEDDPQSGADHVSSHRSIALVASPWVKRRYLSSRHYSMSGLIRAMGLLVDAPALNVYDRHADPLTDIWVTDEGGANFDPYESVYPPIPVQPSPPAELVEASRALGVRDAGVDSVPDDDFNRLLCLHVKATIDPRSRCEEFLRR